MSAEPNFPAKLRISRLHLAGVVVAVVLLSAAAFQMRGKASPAEAPSSFELKACCVAPPVSRAKAFTSASLPKTAPEHAAPHD